MYLAGVADDTIETYLEELYRGMAGPGLIVVSCTATAGELLTGGSYNAARRNGQAIGRRVHEAIAKLWLKVIKAFLGLP